MAIDYELSVRVPCSIRKLLSSYTMLNLIEKT